MKNIKIAFVALTVVVALITLFIRIPLPSRGYFNFGDVAVVFSGLVLGSLARKIRPGFGNLQDDRGSRIDPGHEPEAGHPGAQEQ